MGGKPIEGAGRRSVRTRKCVYGVSLLLICRSFLMGRHRPRRRSMRIDGHDYRLPRWYFITAVTWKRQCLFGRVERGQMNLNQAGRILTEEWRRTERLRETVKVDAFVVMPNHVHGILRIRDAVDDPSGELPPARRSIDHRTFGQSIPHSLPTIAGCIKAATTRRIRQLEGFEGQRIWQRGFHDRIIRTPQELNAKRHYIRTNPRRWGGCSG